MLRSTLFKFGPFDFCLLNLVVLAIIFSSAYLARKIIHKNLKRYLINANILVEGRRATILRIVSQSTYLFAFYLAIYSFRINNDQVTFGDFFNYNIINGSKIKINFLQIVTIVAVVLIGKMVINFIRLYCNKKFRSKEDYNPSQEYVYVQIGKYIVMVVGFFMILNVLNINPGVFLGGSAAVLVGLGLGLQDVFKDWVSGLVLLFEGSIKIGDIIELKDSKFKEPIVAKILKINVRTTQIETRDGNILLIPNAKLTQEYIENWNQGKKVMRFTIDLVVPYNSNTELVCQLLQQAALSHPKVNKNQPVTVRMRDFGERGLNLELLFWVNQTWDANNYKSEVRFEIDRLFRQYNIPFPSVKREVTFIQKQDDSKQS